VTCSQADVEAVVNTVNTDAAMGKGIALQFKEAFPANFEAYRAACKRGEVHVGYIAFDTAASLACAGSSASRRT
jgi:O-acetyl-ADP-ribose deacetylase (regulator of RNase III)